MSQRTRSVSTRVLPLPAPAIRTAGLPTGCCTAAVCFSFSCTLFPFEPGDEGSRVVACGYRYGAVNDGLCISAFLDQLDHALRCLVKLVVTGVEHAVRRHNHETVLVDF